MRQHLVIPLPAWFWPPQYSLSEKQQLALRGHNPHEDRSEVALVRLQILVIIVRIRPAESIHIDTH